MPDGGERFDMTAWWRAEARFWENVEHGRWLGLWQF